MSRRSFDPRAAIAASTLGLALVGSSFAVLAQTTTNMLPPRTTPPIPIAPINDQARLAPVIFQWNVGGSNGNVYGITVQGVSRGRLVVAQNVASYELQIASADPQADDRSFQRVLFDTATSMTTFTFLNNRALQNDFTNNVTNNAALPSGRYWWRVRLNQPGAPFSDPQRFQLLANPAVTTPTHQLAIDSLTLGAFPRAQAATLIVATISNSGTLPESPTRLHIFANGVPVADGDVPALTPLAHVQLVSAWIPQRAGIAQISAQIDTPAANDPTKTHLSRAFTIAQAKMETMTLAGTVQGPDAQHADYTLHDNGGHTIATVIAARSLNLDGYVGRRVTIRGSVSEGALGLLMQASSIVPAS